MNKLPSLPYLIVELANTHGGKIATLMSLISNFGKLNYQKKGIKFQIFSPDGIALPDFKWFSVYKELFFDEDSWSDIINQASVFGDIWVDIFDNYGLKIISNNLDKIRGIKLQSSVLENLEIRNQLKTIDLKDKSLIINISGIDLNTAQVIYEEISGFCGDVILQIGYQSYPTKIENTGLQKISILAAAFPGIPICMADHADAETDFSLNAPVYAALLGCKYIEKHYCLARKEAKYDGYSSMEHIQLQKVCDNLQEAFQAYDGSFINRAESEYLKQTIQIPVLTRNMLRGEIIGPEDIIYRRTSQIGIGMSEIMNAQSTRMVLKNSKKEHDTIILEDYRKARIAVIVAGRMKSSRLQKKAILPIAGVPSVERCLAQCKSIKNIDQVILATSDLDSDNILNNYTLNGEVAFWQGHPDDVIDRYLGACENFNIDVVVRITADCPLVLPEIIELLIEKHFAAGADYTAAKDCAVGTSGEIINVAALRRVAEHFGYAEHSEYMTWYFINNPEHFKLNIISLPNDLVRPYRMTLDYPEDLKMFESLLLAAGKDEKIYSASEIFNILDSHPEISKINQHLTLKYKTDKGLIDTLNRKTKINSKK